MKRVNWIILALIGLWGCGNFSANEADNTTEFEAEPMEAKSGVRLQQAADDAEYRYDSESSAEPSLNPGSKIIKTGHLEIQASEYAVYLNHVRKVIANNKGYLGSEHEQKTSWRLTNSLEIRVPNERFEPLIDALTTGDGFLHVNSKRIEAQDVGEEYADIEARLKTKKAVEAQYLEILTQAKSIQDILAVREQLRKVREEIDAFEGRRKYLDSKISFSTIYLEVYQDLDGVVVERPGFWNRSGNAFKTGWRGIQEGVIVAFGLWPLWIIIIGLVWLIRRRRRKLKANRS
ncbi:MAG: DUF4349 domain-containing protein [Bacteroidetes bacterium]|nr:DUF4349 domain-containing protein [Bacteroidota bacterium]